MSTSPIALWGLPRLPPIGPTVRSGSRTYPPRVAPVTPVRSSHRRSETNEEEPIDDWSGSVAGGSRIRSAGLPRRDPGGAGAAARRRQGAGDRLPCRSQGGRRPGDGAQGEQLDSGEMLEFGRSSVL